MQLKVSKYVSLYCDDTLHDILQSRTDEFSSALSKLNMNTESEIAS